MHEEYFWATGDTWRCSRTLSFHWRFLFFDWIGSGMPLESLMVCRALNSSNLQRHSTPCMWEQPRSLLVFNQQKLTSVLYLAIALKLHMHWNWWSELRADGWRVQHCVQPSNQDTQTQAILEMQCVSDQRLSNRFQLCLTKVNTLLFPAPESSYDLNTFPEEAANLWLWAPFSRFLGLMLWNSVSGADLAATKSWSRWPRCRGNAFQQWNWTGPNTEQCNTFQANVPCLFMTSNSARFIMLYLHSNAEDCSFHFEIKCGVGRCGVTWVHSSSQLQSISYYLVLAIFALGGSWALLQLLQHASYAIPGQQVLPWRCS